MALLKNVKNEGIFYRTSTLFLIIFAAIFIYSLRGLGEINVDNYVESLGSGNNLFLQTLNVIFFPVVWLCEAVSRGSIVNLLLYLMANAVLLAILFFIGKALYQEGLYTAASLGSSKKAEISGKDIKLETQYMSSLKKELKVILRTRAFSGNTAYINALWPIGVFLLFHMTRDKGFVAAFITMYQMGRDRAEMILIMLMVSIAFIATALNSLATTAFTREGQHLSLIKFIPVPYETQILAKFDVCILFTYPMLLLTDIIICIYMKTPISTCIIFAGMMLMAHVIAVFIGMLLDSISPYIEWDDEYSALRGNLNTFFNMAIMMIIALVVAVIGILLYEVIKLPIAVFYIVMFMILAAVMVRLIMTTPTKIVENIDQM
jgi:ABC-2 type transport system permease protein